MIRPKAMLVIPLSLGLAVVALRAMVFVAPAAHPIRALATWFPGHVEAIADRSMAAIGTAAATGQTITDEARRGMTRVAARAPLNAKPFLVEGTIAQMSGQQAAAERHFLAARFRDPRSSAARYFLADQYLRGGRVAEGLIEMGALARLSERAAQPFAPALAAYARTPGAVAPLRRFFASAPRPRDLTLSLLAEDPRNAALIFELAPDVPTGQRPPPDWQAKLVRALVAAGDYGGAHRTWRRLSGVTDRGLLYNAQFRELAAPPPFNWEFLPGSAGVAEATGGGGLAVIYYGREEAALARQLLLLPAGRYRLAMAVEASTPAGALHWALRCATGEAVLGRLPLANTKANVAAGVIDVPPSCPAQWLELRGQVGDSANTVQVTISGLRLDRADAAS